MNQYYHRDGRADLCSIYTPDWAALSLPSTENPHHNTQKPSSPKRASSAPRERKGTMSCYASIFAPARGSGLAVLPAHRGSGGSVVLPVPPRTHLPRWSGGAPSPKLQASAGRKTAWCATKAGGSSYFPDPEWVDFTKPAPSSEEPSAWMEPWDHTQVNINTYRLRTSLSLHAYFQ